MQNEDSRPAPRDEVLFDIEMALRKEEKLWPKRPRPGDHNRFRPLARKPPAPKHSTPDPWGGSAGTGTDGS